MITSQNTILTASIGLPDWRLVFPQIRRLFLDLIAVIVAVAVGVTPFLEILSVVAIDLAGIGVVHSSHPKVSHGGVHITTALFGEIPHVSGGPGLVAIVGRIALCLEHIGVGAHVVVESWVGVVLVDHHGRVEVDLGHGGSLSGHSSLAAESDFVVCLCEFFG